MTNGTVKLSNFLGCQSKSGGAITVTEWATLQLEAVTINKTLSTSDGGAIHVSSNSNLLVKKSVITSTRSKDGGGIYCSDKSQMLLDSIISSCSSNYASGCVHSIRCNVTMNNVTITNLLPWTNAIRATDSKIEIYNTMAHNEAIQFLLADYSYVSFWNFNMSDTNIVLHKSDAEFRHTLFIRQDGACPVGDIFGSTISLKSAYSFIPKNNVVCQNPATVVHGNVSGRSLTFALILQNKHLNANRQVTRIQYVIPDFDTIVSSKISLEMESLKICKESLISMESDTFDRLRLGLNSFHGELLLIRSLI